LSPLRILVVLFAVSVLTSLSVASSDAGCVVLAWTAPGEDGLVGRAARYDLRFSKQWITPQNFALATPAPGLPAPAAAGVTQSVGVSGLTMGTVYYFAIKTADPAGNWSDISNVVARVPQETAGDPAQLGLSFSIPWPNPARDVARFSYALPVDADMRVEVFDIAGRRVRVLADGARAAGAQDLTYDLRDDRGASLAVGVYLVRARLGETVFMRRLVIAR
jgi:hypothetical protein